MKAYIRELSADKQQNVKSKTIAVGRKMSQFSDSAERCRIVGIYEHLPDRPEG